MRGEARQGKARRGEARRSEARQARQGKARRGKARAREGERGEGDECVVRVRVGVEVVCQVEIELHTSYRVQVQLRQNLCVHQLLEVRGRDVEEHGRARISLHVRENRIDRETPCTPSSDVADLT